jgi:hypothetical protein
MAFARIAQRSTPATASAFRREGEQMADATPHTTLLIHGLWMTPRSLEGFKERDEGRSHTVLAPAWPGMEGEVEALNTDPSPIASLDIEQITRRRGEPW